jgi:vacuolar protein sorting-associated protein 13A/C
MRYFYSDNIYTLFLAPKPFTELSLAMRKSERDNVAQIKYFRVLIQEMAVKVDKGFINAMLELFPNEAVKPASYTV